MNTQLNWGILYLKGLLFCLLCFTVPIGYNRATFINNDQRCDKLTDFDFLLAQAGIDVQSITSYADPSLPINRTNETPSSGDEINGEFLWHISAFGPRKFLLWRKTVSFRNSQCVR